MKKINVYLKHPGQAPRNVDISPAWGNIQNVIGERACVGRVRGDVQIIFDEEGYYSREENCTIEDETYYGPVIFCGSSAKGIDDITVEWDVFKGAFPHLFKGSTGFGLEEV